MTHLLFLSSLFAVAGQNPPSLLVPFKGLSDAGSVADVRDYVVDGQGNHYVYALHAAPSELYLTGDGGRSWRAAPVAPRTVGTVPSRIHEPASIAVDPENADILHDCSPRGIFRSNDSGKLWYLLREGACSQLVVDRGQRNILLATNSAVLIRSIDGGGSWQIINVRAAKIAQDVSGFGLFAALTSAGDVSFSRDRGATWTPAARVANGISGLAFHPHKPNAVYAWSTTELYRTNDQINWLRLPVPANSSFGDVYPDPLTPGQLWLAGAQGLFRTQDDGLSWTLVRAGLHERITGCSAMIATTLGRSVVSANGGKDWAAVPFDLRQIAFGAACNGVGLARRVGQSRLRMYTETNPNRIWNRDITASGVLAVVRDGVGAILHGAGLGVRRVTGDGAELASYDPGGGLAVVADRVLSGTDGSVAWSGPEITLGGRHVAVRLNAQGRRINTASGTLLALDNFNRMVVATDRGLELWNDNNTLERILPLDANTLALQYLPNGDVIAAGWNAPNKIWIARYRDGLPSQIWKQELIGPPTKPAGKVRLQIVSDESAYLEIPARVETRDPFLPQLGGGAADRTFIKLASDGEIEWSTMLPGRRFLTPNPGNRLSVVESTPDAANLEFLSVPNRRIQVIDTVLNADTTALATAYAGDTLVIKGRNLTADPTTIRAKVNGIPAQVLSASVSAVVIVVPSVLNGETARIELELPTGPLSPVEIPANY